MACNKKGIIDYDTYDRRVVKTAQQAAINLHYIFDDSRLWKNA